ncbi:hypothetical protein HYFRA_00010375 [Hymenoscyphus fraxineus]|uniref:Uncharacterized protein n=1 Tax=Hymenoscyphus fraxineus TaxID=746836 RepID=A0A9N9L115_9HELO|nr:hypothetical protein HYFRA_00010375 [Hymenoscyphus fraxineus]
MEHFFRIVLDLERMRSLSADHRERNVLSSEPTRLMSLLRRFSDRKASDDRDKVYALLSLARNQASLVLDYSPSVSRGFQATILDISESTGSLVVFAGDLEERTVKIFRRGQRRHVAAIYVSRRYSRYRGYDFLWKFRSFCNPFVGRASDKTLRPYVLTWSLRLLTLGKSKLAALGPKIHRWAIADRDAEHMNQPEIHLFGARPDGTVELPNVPVPTLPGTKNALLTATVRRTFFVTRKGVLNWAP